MPSITIHEEVGEYLSNIIHINSYDYYLGLLAPDAPNLNGFAEKEIRWKAHVRRKDLQEWRKALQEFYQEEKSHFPKDFIIGYYIHILTDIIYDDFMYLKVRESIEKDGYSREESHQVMRQDMLNYRSENPSWSKILLESTKSYDIQGITKDELSKWKEHQILLNDTIKNNSCKYITDEIINELNELVEKELKKISF